MITELSDFLRYTLVNKGIAFRTLKDELDTLQLYLSIEKKRFEEKLQIAIHVQEEVKNIPIISFLLHPLIENAIKYGMKTSALPLQIKISSYLDVKKLIIEIYNSGKWIEPGKATDQFGTGTGLENVKKRLHNSYDDNFTFEIITDENRVCIKITILDYEQSGKGTNIGFGN